MPNSPQEVLVACREHDVKVIALRAADLQGRWQQMTVPVSRLTNDSFEDGFLWTGGNLNCAGADVGDLLWMPQPETAFVEPFAEIPTLSILCNLYDPLTREELPGDPRSIAGQSLRYLVDAGVAESALMSAEIEFFLVDSKAARRTRPATREPASVYDEHTEQRWQDQVRDWRRGYAVDPAADFRDMVMQTLIDCGVEVDSHRQAGGDRIKGQVTLSEADPLTIADRLLIAKHVIKRAAARVGKAATFMPTPPGTSGSAGLHLQLSLVKHGASVLAGAGYAGLSDVGLHAIGGLLTHARALCAFTNASTNSYARLAAGDGAPSVLGYSEADVRTVVRIPSVQPGGRSKQLELRLPDSSGNPYLSAAAVLMAAIDGVQNKLSPGEPAAAQWEGDRAELTDFARLPHSLDEALDGLSDDGEFLLRGDVFSHELLESWISWKQTSEIAKLRAQPHPIETAMYFDV
ncbi:MAG: glutamine synthetase beta-grasp domain-containing protein [Pirellulales bacterium]